VGKCKLHAIQGENLVMDMQVCAVIGADFLLCCL
jgi:hypothetical protein